MKPGRVASLWIGLGVLLASAGGAAEDPRSTVLLRKDCATDIDHRELTLFANGTVRLRQGRPRKERMQLLELGPDELEGFLARLGAEDPENIDDAQEGPGGEWVERCVLELALPGAKRYAFRWGQYDSLSLGLSRLVGIAEELGLLVQARQGARGLPRSYTPQVGDILRRRTGGRYEVVGFTSDDRGVELVGLDTPLTLYVARDGLRQEFVALEPGSRRRE